jgi:hypothetical protein
LSKAHNLLARPVFFASFEKDMNSGINDVNQLTSLSSRRNVVCQYIVVAIMQSGKIFNVVCSHCFPFLFFFLFFNVVFG